ncbi:MAG: hypothetical protein AB1714_29775 [Acidobacteriota bacterium]
MEAESEFDLGIFLKWMESGGIPCLLIGRWAVIIHGAPLMTADYDFWISPAHRKRVLALLERRGFEVPDRSKWNKPLVTVYCGTEKIDLHSQGAVTNAVGRRLEFKDCLARAETRSDPSGAFKVRIPCIDDLMALKKVQRTNPQDAVKDGADIRFLEAIRRKAGK